ncbi:hypothetical protein [Gluconobacter oxydans]|uniref:hypothetical protein n=1 Tax=Gluconobacter oxydans TaxID=442 RepID=UPI00209C9A80|nr:hypothetical protein [Gluconobacter oxydans]MCP1249704.1 hypothetical protein [Gluconobacter oxydans]WKE47406.1 hypothetical protein NUJ38_08600 [Gluconobacter oxydans]
MSKAFLAAVLQDSMNCTGVVAQRAVNDMIDAIIEELREEGGGFEKPFIDCILRLISGFWRVD